MGKRIEITQEQLEAVDALVQLISGHGRKQYLAIALRLGLDMSGFTLQAKHRAWVENGKVLPPKPDLVAPRSLTVRYYHQNGLEVDYAAR